FPGDGVTGANGGWQGWSFCKDLTGSGGVAGLIKDKWANIVCVYNGTTREGIMYINGEKMKAFDFDLWPEGDVKRGVVGMKYGGTAPDVLPELAFGFIQSRAGTLWDGEPWGGYDFPDANHFDGKLDDIRIFHKPLTDTEISLMYASEKP
ncbi:MAG: LamG domain-containing protein, partial [Bacteroidales bacterium]|nr:LamG domain-containing protein [Bacteroidales bacterium]